MIQYRKGNLLDVTSGIIIHVCNMQGIMDSGVALAIKNKYPDCFVKYKYQLDNFNYHLGMDIVYRVSPKLIICNALTQEFYTKKSRQLNCSAIVRVFDRLIPSAQREDMTLHFPKIGADLAGGDWNTISQLILDCDPHDTIHKICWEL